MVNFTYDPVPDVAIAFVLTIHNATINVIHPIIALGLNHGETILYPSEHRAWAQMVDKKWQTVNVESCVTQEQQGFLCESNTTDPQDIGLDTQQGVCHLEIHADIIQKTVLVYLDQDFVLCLRTACASVRVDNENKYLPVKKHSNFCICNLDSIIGCDFTYSVPVVSHQMIKASYIMYHHLSPTPIGMNRRLVKWIIKHPDLDEILKEIKENGEEVLITVHHDAEEISKVLQRIKQETSHPWWDALFGWSPKATGILNALVHPVIVLLILVGIRLILSIAVLIWNWRMVQ